MESSEKEVLPKLVLSGSANLHPESCGSSIRWTVIVKQRRHEYNSKVVYHRSLDANVHLTDCSRQISWGTDHEGKAQSMIDKLDVAIAELQKARAAVVEGQSFYEGLKQSKDEDE